MPVAVGCTRFLHRDHLTLGFREPEVEPRVAREPLRVDVGVARCRRGIDMAKHGSNDRWLDETTRLLAEATANPQAMDGSLFLGPS